MSDKPAEAHGADRYRNEVRDTIIKSGLSGVAATVLAVTIWSPAGLGGMIGTSLAAGVAHDADSSAAAGLTNLAPYPAPISAVELADIRARLSASSASLDALRAATDANIEHIRSIAASAGAISVAPMADVAQVGGGMRVVPVVAEAAPVAEDVEVAAAAPAVAVEYAAPFAQFAAPQAPVNYTSGGGDDYATQSDPNMELAALLFAL